MLLSRDCWDIKQREGESYRKLVINLLQVGLQLCSLILNPPFFPCHPSQGDLLTLQVLLLKLFYN